MSADPATLLFISPRFLFPVDSGGRIRTTQTLRGMKGGRFKIRLMSPCTEELANRYRTELGALCDEFHWWSQGTTGPTIRLGRARHLFSRVPISVASDYLPTAAQMVQRELVRGCDVVVFDFLHSVIVAPKNIDTPSVLFTHNVEAEIFARHLKAAAGNPVMRALWTQQHRKMREFERGAVRRFDTVVAVSERDGKMFHSDYGLPEPFVIPTGVDLSFFAFAEPTRDRDVVFLGSMDWLANQQAVHSFLEDMWPLIIREVPDAQMTVVGRTPPDWLVKAARRYGDAWRFTGFVDDVRPYVSGSAVSVIPMRVAGGTRLKVYESMAMGSVVVSTRIGVEGLPVRSGEHCIVEDDPVAFANATVLLLKDRAQRIRMAAAARKYVQENFGFQVAARAFEQACLLAIERRTSRSSAAPAAVVAQ